MPPLRAFRERILTHPTMNDWDVTPSQAIEVQNLLKEKVVIQPLDREIHTIGGADISFNLYSTTAYAVFVVLDRKTLTIIDKSHYIGELKFPYIPGLLSFREIPLLMEAWNRLKTKPDLVFIDGQGIAHPRRLGVASHFGVLVGVPTLGCAKSKLVGTYIEPPLEAKSHSNLLHQGKTIGFAYRTKKNVSPLYVSPGHLMSLKDVLRILNSMDCKYRIPEPTRQAHLYANELRKKYSGPN